MLHQMRPLSRIDLETSKPDSRANTSEPIYEAHRRRELEGKTRSKLVFFLSSFLTISAVLTIGLLQYDEFIAFINERDDYIEATKSFCNSLAITNIDLIATPIACAIVLLYILIYKRRVFLRDKFKYRNVGLPMMVSCWNKTDRMFSAFTYGLIAFNVFGIVKTSLDGTNKLKNISNVYDPSGILALFYKIFQMFLVGIRYYPVLVAYRVNTFLISITCVIYLWIDFVENIYQYGKCESITTEGSSDIDETKRRLGFYIAYKVLSAIPLSIFSSFIIITLSYKAAINLIDFILRYRSPKTRSILIEKSRDTMFCMIANVDDDNEIFYSKYDFDYVLKLLEKEPEYGEEDTSKAESEYSSKEFPKHPPQALKYVTVKKPHESFPFKIFKKIYRPDPTFRFTSRYVNTITVALVALYYVFLYWTYTVSMFTSQYIGYIPNSVDGGNVPVDVGDLLCNILPDYCLEQLQSVGPINLPLPNKIVQILPTIRQQLLAICVTPLFVSALLCILQMFFLVKETRRHLQEMYKGKCEFVRKASSLKKTSIASSSFHFGGYTVGYLVWGYFIIYFTGVIVGALIIALRLFIGDAIFWQILLRIVPVVTVIIIKRIVNKISTNYWFLYRKSSILALNNFRAFNVFLYFNFYFDCFMGAISAIFRLILSVIVAILMMPRISYSFMGRHFERFDSGYSCYSGFLHMEAMHTNPIIICFCSLLYYKDLNEHLSRYKRQRRALMHNRSLDDFKDVRVHLNKFTGRLSVGDGDMSATISTNDFDSSDFSHQQQQQRKRLLKRDYNIRVVNRWHLYLRMTLNKEIIIYRKHNMIKRNRKPKEQGLFDKVKNKIKSICNRQE